MKRGDRSNQADGEKTMDVCDNCGAKGHKAKYCVERPRAVGAKYTKKHIAPDDKMIKSVDKNYAAKHDRWDGYNFSNYCAVTDLHDARTAARTDYLKQEKLRKPIDPNVDDAVVDESKQMDSANVEESVKKTRASGSSNPRVREDTVKYLFNLDDKSAYYDPKSRSMREDPLQHTDPNEKFYSGDNFVRFSGHSLEISQPDSLEAFAPTQTESLYKSYKASKKQLQSQKMETILKKYGNAAAEKETLLLGQRETKVHCDRASERESHKYEENITLNNHTSIWGSWWIDHKWGYKCCKQIIKDSYCTSQTKDRVTQDPDQQ